jgi:hypothetical protein
MLYSVLEIVYDVVEIDYCIIIYRVNTAEVPLFHTFRDILITIRIYLKKNIWGVGSTPLDIRGLNLNVASGLIRLVGYR